ncbi:MAG: hypothetical protein ACKPB0_05405, partial [Opitutaceae bacterium]
WIEGNVLPAPGGRLVNLLRTNPRTGTGAPSRTSTVVTMVDIVDDGRRQTWAPATAVVPFPGGGGKFTIRHDARSGRYWSLPNLQADPAAYRSIVVLASSADLRAWRVEATILQHPEPRHHAWQLNELKAELLREQIHLARAKNRREEEAVVARETVREMLGVLGQKLDLLLRLKLEVELPSRCLGKDAAELGIEGAAILDEIREVVNGNLARFETDAVKASAGP